MKRIIFTIFFILTGLTALLAQDETSAFDVNGIKVIFKPTVKNMISVRVYFRGGVSNISAAQAGIENLTLEAAIKCGTAKHTADQFKDIADYYSISLSSGAENDYSQVEMSCISKYFNEGWGLLTEAINTPVFDQAEFQLVQNKLISDVKQAESSPDKHIEQLILKNGFAGTPYAVDPDGTEATLSAFTVADLKTYYATMLNKNKMFIVIAGKITQQQVIDKVTAAFGNLPSAPYQPIAMATPVFNDNKTLAEQRSLSTNYINGIINAPAMTNADFIPFRLAVSAFSGVLFSELRTKRNLSYDPGAYSVNKRMPYAVMYISTTNPGEAVSVMVNQLNRIKNLKISNRGLNEMKSGFITSNYMKLQSSSAITANLGIYEILGGWYYFESLPARLEQVTAEQVSTVLGKYAVGIRWAYLGDVELAKKSKEVFDLKVK